MIFQYFVCFLALSLFINTSLLEEVGKCKVMNKIHPHLSLSLVVDSIGTLSFFVESNGKRSGKDCAGLWLPSCPWEQKVEPLRKQDQCRGGKQASAVCHLPGACFWVVWCDCLCHRLWRFSSTFLSTPKIRHLPSNAWKKNWSLI